MLRADDFPSPMDPAPSDPVEHARRLRQQLLLAQVRVMEIEDERDATTARLADLEKLLSAAQGLADTKLDEAVHLARTLAELQAAYRNLTTDAEEKEQRLQVVHASLSAAQNNLANERTLRSTLEARAEQLVTELNATKATRSWRWTAWLRAIGKSVGRK